MSAGGDAANDDHPGSTRPAGPRAPAPKHALRKPVFWLGPLVVVGIVMGLLGALYLGSMLNPIKHLSHFPIAVVDQDAGTDLPSAGGVQKVDLGGEITNGLLAQIDHRKVDLRRLDMSTAQAQLDSGKIYGAIVIPVDFSAQTVALGAAVLTDKPVDKPVVTVLTNPRAGSVSVQFVQTITDQALTQVSKNVSTTLTPLVQNQLAARPGSPPLSAAATYVLSDPITVHTVAHNPLPADTGLGLSAFYFALLLTLAGFTGSTIIHTLVDSQLGFVPAEFGPRYIFRDRVELTRTQTLLVKWVLVLLMAMVVSALYLWIGHLLGMPLPNVLLIWEYGVLVITAIGVSTVSVMAIFGSVGLLVNLLVFVVFGLPSSGGTIPLEATPGFYQWLAGFEPMHQVFVGTRALLYFGGRLDAGLAHAAIMAAIGLAIGAAIGLIATRYYDRKGHDRAVREQLTPTEP
ncbi:YhgE/Pip domain-containing protein [Speluncibacter jeojiensis]|uniref:YhgE/Pip domain-containing protein n=1 Tax=Speluncibacter jeojiensis TaxID=2710754 RepID=UPI002FCA0182